MNPCIGIVKSAKRNNPVGKGISMFATPIHCHECGLLFPFGPKPLVPTCQCYEWRWNTRTREMLRGERRGKARLPLLAFLAFLCLCMFVICANVNVGLNAGAWERQVQR